MTSHAAVVARGMGECCVSGCGDIVMDEANKKFTLGGKEFHEGDPISIDGTTGNIYDGITAARSGKPIRTPPPATAGRCLKTAGGKTAGQ